MTFRHVSAMLPEVIEALACRAGGIYVDCTLGGAGHAEAICRRIMPGGKLVGIDQDDAAIAHARQVLSGFGDGVRLFHGNFIHLPDYLAQLQIKAVDGILLDLGLSQYQLDSSGRGFSFQKDEPLDMRMDARTDITARDLVNQLDESRLSNLFWEFGEERWSRRIACAIVAARRVAPIRTTGQLTKVVCGAVPAGPAAKRKIHPATRVFMALRIAVNQELANLARFLGFAVELLAVGGRMCVLSFHSLEDRQVKQCFKQLAKGCVCPPAWPKCMCDGRPKVRLITKKVARPSVEEVTANPMARSTRLRVVEKLAA
jgi:16S rRNA (cytosine1402-N4)-methyltransferase